MFKYTLLLVISTLVVTVLSAITQPGEGETWIVGETVTISIAPGKKSETVNLFLDHDRSIVIGGGDIENGKTIDFIVPANAVNPNGGPTLLTAVFRIDRYLDSVDTVNINVT